MFHILKNAEEIMKITAERTYKSNPHDPQTHYNDEAAYQAGIPHHPYRKRSPKRQVRVHVSNRVKKGPLESKG